MEIDKLNIPSLDSFFMYGSEFKIFDSGMTQNKCKSSFLWLSMIPGLG